MADWDASNPLDNSVVSQFPANERASRAAAVTNFGVDHHETNDADVGKHEAISLLEQGSDPSAASNEGQLYALDVSGATELFYRDSSGNIVPITLLGRVLGQPVPQVISTSPVTAVAGDVLLVDASGGARTVNLPASPNVGDEPISVTQIAGSASQVTIGRNGNLIMGLAENMTLDVADASIVLFWSGATYGWRLGIIG